MFAEYMHQNCIRIFWKFELLELSDNFEYWNKYTVYTKIQKMSEYSENSKYSETSVLYCIKVLTW